MPRNRRVHAEGLLYHVMARRNDGQEIFLGESDYLYKSTDHLTVVG